jgi:hypothetical protein
VAKRTPGQLPLDDAAPKVKGVVERASERDLRDLRSAGTIPQGMAALEAAYRLTAREVDRAEREADRWGKLNATRELRAVRERLGVIEPDNGTDADAWWDEMRRAGAAAGGDTPQPGPADDGPPDRSGGPGTVVPPAGPDAPPAPRS